jgi:hypothetical protein
MWRYFTKPPTRAAVRERIARLVSDDTRMIVAHSFGAVVAYEALYAPPVHTLITLGPPFGGPAVFEWLGPRVDAASPLHDLWPGGVESWIDIVSRGDVVGAGQNLRSLFGRAVEMHVVAHGRGSHIAERYLASPVTGTAISAGSLANPGPRTPLRAHLRTPRDESGGHSPLRQTDVRHPV